MAFPKLWLRWVSSCSCQSSRLPLPSWDHPNHQKPPGKVTICEMFPFNKSPQVFANTTYWQLPKSIWFFSSSFSMFTPNGSTKTEHCLPGVSFAQHRSGVQVGQAALVGLDGPLRTVAVAGEDHVLVLLPPSGLGTRNAPQFWSKKNGTCSPYVVLRKNKCPSCRCFGFLRGSVGWFFVSSQNGAPTGLVDLGHGITMAHASLNETGKVGHTGRHHRVAHHDRQAAVPGLEKSPCWNGIKNKQTNKETNKTKHNKQTNKKQKNTKQNLFRDSQQPKTLGGSHSTELEAIAAEGEGRSAVA